MDNYTTKKQIKELENEKKEDYNDSLFLTAC